MRKITEQLIDIFGSNIISVADPAMVNDNVIARFLNEEYVIENGYELDRNLPFGYGRYKILADRTKPLSRFIKIAETTGHWGLKDITDAVRGDRWFISAYVPEKGWRVEEA